MVNVHEEKPQGQQECDDCRAEGRKEGGEGRTTDIKIEKEIRPVERKCIAAVLEKKKNRAQCHVIT